MGSNIKKDQIISGMSLVIDTHRSTFVIRPEDINYLEAEGSYTRFSLMGLKSTVRTAHNLKSFEYWCSKQPRFVKVGRGLVVNLESIAEIQKDEEGAGCIFFRDKTCYSISAGLRKKLLQVLLNKTLVPNPTEDYELVS